uniref:Uncharacterized protein n=1 Tax=Arundo donax TaxID=35708 RepID=A0A0A9G3H4_ARUDO
MFHNGSLSLFRSHAIYPCWNDSKRADLCKEVSNFIQKTSSWF